MASLVSVAVVAISFFCGTVAAAAGRSACTSFGWSNTGVATLTAATYYTTGDLVNVSSSGGVVLSNSLPPFCRIQLVVHTNPATNNSALTEVWLPDTWDHRFLAVGNGGWSGGIFYGDLAYAGVSNQHAVVGTDGGHEGGVLSGVFAAGNPEAIIDYSWRAVHLSVVAAKEITAQYYSSTPKKNYYLGCSTGGRQGLKSVQFFPDDFDGVVVGSPANWLSHLAPWSIHIDLLLLPVNSSTWIPVPLWSVIHAEVLKQCDGLDGVVDGIINDPRKCFFRPEAIACRPGQDPTTCLTLPQIGALRKIYTDYYETNQTYIFGGYYYGGELIFPTGGLLTPAPTELSVDYYKYMVLNDSTWDPTTLNYTTIQIGDFINPGSMNANDPNITAYAGPSHNGKILHYVGWADQIISPGNSLHYYETVDAFQQSTTELNIDDYYRLFTVPGMYHCSGGPGANAFGGQGQAAAGMPPGAPDASHDILRAMIDWVENGNAPEKLIATKYPNDNGTLPAAFTRPLCMFPKEIVWDGKGNTNHSSSFYCQ